MEESEFHKNMAEMTPDASEEDDGFQSAEEEQDPEAVASDAPPGS